MIARFRSENLEENERRTRVRSFVAYRYETGSRRCLDTRIVRWLPIGRNNPMSSTNGNVEAHDEDRLLAPPEAARFLGNSVDTLTRWRINGDGPPYIKLGTSRSHSVRLRFSGHVLARCATERALPPIRRRASSGSTNGIESEAGGGASRPRADGSWRSSRCEAVPRGGRIPFRARQRWRRGRRGGSRSTTFRLAESPLRLVS